MGKISFFKHFGKAHVGGFQRGAKGHGMGAGKRMGG